LESIWKEAFIAEWKYCPGVYVEKLMETTKTSVTIAVEWAEIQTQHLLSTSPEGYQQIKSVLISPTSNHIHMTERLNSGLCGHKPRHLDAARIICQRRGALCLFIWLFNFTLPVWFCGGHNDA
jgi:hypothetical protein